MQKHHWSAVALAGIAIILLIVDRVIAVVTGDATFVTDDSRGSALGTLAMSALLGCTFLSLAWVVHRESTRFANARRPARLARPVLTYGLLFLGGGFLTVYPLQTLSGLDEDAATVQVSGLVAFTALTSAFLAAFVVGLAVLGRNPLGIGGSILSLMGPVVLLTVLLGLVAPSMASPVYTTMVVLAGVSLIGVRAEWIAPRETQAASAPSTSAF